ncbi:Phosphoribosyl-AMP cyclohydrolase [Roseomonas mucosa]|jgi:phosphoribosyl-AMP cyclohydrolase|uniref:Phosphoribosyl-AMP cyclohydrolase n=1 Tax=Roseomonas mucosa TaxID=207340 RepID=A0A1S8D6J7_9PROT|nr:MULTISPECIES: phosphoribosyl-AMP cyclohydrolase [Roseomonas]MBS5901680.1 phosphoribosyl-AMP cyclohydrolase [Acetobacteraceae bacterium]MDT8265418.1 phosphoribosyl-AMP cyclohydrolase [Roseomonas sp. DSM 102946]ATR20028.1 phosphoribosyl-AMP cyclohydrolase [Roseomonas sp. FDAARGOS_362]AWV23524.1 Phosphoribosyl-AMP cyclohydrolase [Roseomonas mucosa]MCG7353140.1 phosphoribosyl-AMP cyclohydrolase [Roseomonas mucosa]
MQSHPIAAPGTNPGPDAGTAPQPPGEAAIARFLGGLRFDAQGLVAAVAQQHDTGEVLMLAWMNREAVAETLRTGRVTYYSRSRQGLWRKGDTSGQVQHLRELRLDCDGDAVLALVDQVGVACHTGRRSCFSWALRGEALAAIAEPLEDPATLYGTAAPAHGHSG